MLDFQQLEADYIIGKLGNLLFNVKEYLAASLNFPSLLILLTLVLSLTFILLALRKTILIWKSSKDLSVLLELTPPHKTEQEAYTTEQFFSLIHALGKQRTFIDHLLGNKTRFSLEIVSTRKQGIRYLLKAAPKEVNSLRRSLLSYLPQMAVKSVGEYLPENTREFRNHHFRIVEFKLSKHFAYPLKKQDQLTKHDPIAYITGMMTKLEPSELISLQIIVSPVKPKEVKEISNIILYNGDILNHLNTLRVSIYFWLPVTLLKLGFTAFFILFSIPFWIISNLATRGQTPFPSLPFTSQSIVRSRNTFEQEMVSSIHAKINQPLFEATIRLLVVVKKRKDIGERLRGLISSFATFSHDGLQSIVPKRSLNLDFVRRYLFFMFAKRQFALSNKSILSASEISDIYHFPYTDTTKTENIVKVYSKDLPAPLSLKKNRDLDVVFGVNSYGGKQTAIGLTDETRDKHVFIVGATGSGKSTVLFNMASGDLQKGRGVAIIDPHGDLAENLLNMIPTERINDFVYINPYDLKYPVGINLLELPTGLDEDGLELEKELVCESVISIFRKVFTKEDNVDAHRIEYILRNTIYTAFEVPDRTIFTIYNLLNDPEYRKEVIANLSDENLRNFWKNEFGKAGNFQIVKMVSGVTAKVGRFLFSPTARRILEQKHSTFDFNEIFAQKKILICNLAEGKLGEDTSQILGMAIISKIQQAAQRRVRQELSTRTPFYLYIDEFQNFATSAFTKILSGGRKFGLRIIIAEQSTSQQKDKDIVNIILANVGTVICFRTAGLHDEQYMLGQFAPSVEKGELANLPRYNFYMKISAVEPEEPFSGKTLKPDIEKDSQKIRGLVEASRKNYAIIYEKPVVIKKEEVKAEKKAKSKAHFPENKTGKR